MFRAHHDSEKYGEGVEKIHQKANNNCITLSDFKLHSLVDSFGCQVSEINY